MTDENTQNQAGDGEDPNSQEQTPEQLKAENARLKQEKIDLDKRLADKDSHITNLTNVNQTLEQRFKATNSQNQEEVDLEKEAADLMAEAKENPETAGKKLAALIKKTKDSGAQSVSQTVENVVSQREKVNKLREANKDLIEIGLEMPITVRANELMKQGKSFEDAANTACSEFREKLKGKLVLKNNQDGGENQEAGAGAQGESGASGPGNAGPAASKGNQQQPKKDLSSADSRAERLALTGLC